jgi:hypothetical protein
MLPVSLYWQHRVYGDEEEHRTNEKYRETGNTGYTETKKNTGQMKNTEKLAT